MVLQIRIRLLIIVTRWVFSIAVAIAQPDVMRLDDADLALVSALRLQPRATAAELGQALGVSASTAGARLRRLLDTGALRVVGYVHPGALPGSAMAVVFARARGAAALADDLGACDGVQLAVEVFGSSDLLVTLVASDAAALHGDIDRLVRSRAHVHDVHVLRMLDHTVMGVPDLAPVPIRDELDRDLALMLGTDARATFTSLAEALGIPNATARARAQRLLDGGAVAPLVLPDPVLFGLPVTAVLAMRVDGPSAGAYAALPGIPGMLLAVRTEGAYDIGVEVVAPHLDALGAVREGLAALPGVRGIDTYVFGHRCIGTRPLPRLA